MHLGKEEDQCFNVHKNPTDLMGIPHLLLRRVVEKLVKPRKVDVITFKVHGLVTKRQTNKTVAALNANRLNYISKLYQIKPLNAIFFKQAPLSFSNIFT